MAYMNVCTMIFMASHNFTAFLELLALSLGLFQRICPPNNSAETTAVQITHSAPLKQIAEHKYFIIITTIVLNDKKP